MAFDILPFGVTETALSVGIGASANSAGATPAPLTAGMGLTVLVQGTADGTFDLLVQTAPDGAGPADNWLDLASTRLNAQTGQDTYNLPFVDGILDQVRLRVVRTGGTGVATFTPSWLSDRQGITLN